jgi:hypothetical protein
MKFVARGYLLREEQSTHAASGTETAVTSRARDSERPEGRGGWHLEFSLGLPAWSTTSPERRFSARVRLRAESYGD